MPLVSVLPLNCATATSLDPSDEEATDVQIAFVGALVCSVQFEPEFPEV